ncbi:MULTISPECIES: hypothetical protein [unclassified Paenibacillus]|nr:MULTISPECIES: hypothetical protein [unclassified Paenibacillus]
MQINVISEPDHIRLVAGFEAIQSLDFSIGSIHDHNEVGVDKLL